MTAITGQIIETILKEKRNMIETKIETRNTEIDDREVENITTIKEKKREKRICSSFLKQTLKDHTRMLNQLQNSKSQSKMTKKRLK